MSALESFCSFKYGKETQNIARLSSLFELVYYPYLYMISFLILFPSVLAYHIVSL